MSVFWQDGGFVNEKGQPVNEDGTLLNQATPAAADMVSRDEYNRVVQDSQTQALQLAEVTTERNEALGREQGKSEEAARLADVRGLLTSQLGEVKADLDKKTAEWQTERDSLLQDTADSLKREDALKQQVADLQAQLAAQGDGDNAAPGDADQRTKAQLKAALDGASVTYDPATKRDGLVALAAEHKV